ncbi:MAG: hypothetical protein EHM28_02995 [Spirochaetaceae bacterium]|nr:MAG: hypothetical protein EHM28_02995 [Spirochaetaceae bacterium]
MKKFLVLALICILATSAFAQDIKFGAGISLDYMPMFQNLTVDVADTDVNTSMNLLGVSAYFDASFVSLAVGYAFTMGGSTDDGRVFGVDVDNETNDDFTMSMFTITLLGKYPFDMGGWYLFPMVGIEYSIMIMYSGDGGDTNMVGETGYDDMNDIVLLGGVGAAFMVDKFVIAPKVLFIYNLTPAPVEDPDPAEISQWGIAIGINVGYMF